jgi:hypothetical protein
MCSTTSPTTFTGGPINIVGTVPPPGANQPLAPFAPVAYPTLDLDTIDTPLLQALTDAIAAVGAAGLGTSQKVAFSILCFATNGHHRYAGVGDNTMHYSGSLLKVAAMYAAHELLAAANRLPQTPGPHRATPTAFYAGLVTAFDTQIRAESLPDVIAAAEALATKLPAFRATPSYEKIFTVTGTGTASAPSVDFSGDFTTQMRKMIEVSDNDAAGECVRRLSYTYVIAVHLKAGFLAAGPPRNGIWFAGDYTNGANPTARVNSDNDQLAAQVTTTKQMLRVFALIRLHKLVTQDGNDVRMNTLLGLAAALGGWFHFGPLSPPAVQPFDLVLSKIGRGPLKAGGETFSEAQVLKWTGAGMTTPAPATKGLTGEFVVCWQNLHIAKIAGMVDVFRRTYAKLLV